MIKRLMQWLSRRKPSLQHHYKSEVDRVLQQYETQQSPQSTSHMPKPIQYQNKK
jgi:hypothetical protein